MPVREGRTLHLISLGCPKNRVDSELLLGLAEQAGYRYTDCPDEAELIVVNTCAFIEPARRESIETILECAQYKQRGRCRRLVVAGCLSQRYPTELARELPEVDHFLGTGSLPRFGHVLAGRARRIEVAAPGCWLPTARHPRRLTTAGASAYLKIAEGCNRRCSFCVIPRIRGRLRSRPVPDLLEEVERLLAQGVREINLVAQETTAYGRDLQDGTSLARLMERISNLSGVHWVRALYLYPSAIDQHLLSLWAEHPRVPPYVDLPLQHVSDRVLRMMRRGYDGRLVRSLVERIRDRVPGATLRTELIVGHPGESQADFAELKQFVAGAGFDRVGVFVYSDEPETRAHGLRPKVGRGVATRRAQELDTLATAVSVRKTEALVGQKLEVLVEGPSPEHRLVFVGRHAGQAPEIDGAVVLSGGRVSPGELRVVRIVQAVGFDLLGELEDIHSPRSEGRECPPSCRSGQARPESRVGVATGHGPGEASSSRK